MKPNQMPPVTCSDPKIGGKGVLRRDTHIKTSDKVNEMFFNAHGNHNKVICPPADRNGMILPIPTTQTGRYFQYQPPKREDWHEIGMMLDTKGEMSNLTDVD